MKTRLRDYCLIVCGVLCLAVVALFIPRSVESAPKPKDPKWGTITTPSIPAGLSSWNNATANTNEYMVTYQITDVEGSFVLTVDSIEALTHDSLGNTLTTYWKCTTDGNGISSTGILASGGYESQGRNNFVTAAAFLNPGITVTYVAPDATVTLFVTSRGENPEDSGSNSDATEAPIPGTYTAELNLDAAVP